MVFNIKNSIKSKLIGIIVLAVVAALSVSSFLIYISASKALTEYAEHSVMLLSQSLSKEVGLWLDEKKAYVATLANLPLIQSGEREAVFKYLSAEMGRRNHYEALFVINEYGEYFSCMRDANGNLINKGGNAKDWPGFIEAMKGKAMISDPTISKDTGNQVAIVAIPIKKDEKVIGVMAGAVLLDELVQRLGAVNVGKTGYVYLVQGDGLIIVHPDKNTTMKNNLLQDKSVDANLRQATGQVTQGREGVARYTWNKVEKYMGYAPVSGVNWGLCVNVPVAEVTEQLSTMKEIAIGTPLLIALIIIVIAGILINRLVTRPLSRISDKLKDFNNDLTLRLQSGSKDEIGDLAKWFNDLLQDLHKIISKVAEETVKVNSYAGDTAQTVEQQASFSLELSSSVAEISATMEEFASTSVQIAEHSQGVAQLAVETLERSRHGVAQVEALMEKMDGINRENQRNILEIEALGQKSQEINKIMEIINNIASQTRLIAFNAALEAASAGEAGKRFGVVAVEIRHLADNVMESVKEIEGKTNEIMKAVNRQIVTSENNGKGIEEGFDYSRRTASIISEIQEAAEQTTDAVQQISLSIQQQQTGSEQVVAALRQIQDGTRENSQMNQQTNSLSKDLAALAEELKRLVGIFKI